MDASAWKMLVASSSSSPMTSPDVLRLEKITACAALSCSVCFCFGCWLCFELLSGFILNPLEWFHGWKWASIGCPRGPGVRVVLRWIFRISWMDLQKFMRILVFANFKMVWQLYSSRRPSIQRRLRTSSLHHWKWSIICATFQLLLALIP